MAALRRLCRRPRSPRTLCPRPHALRPRITCDVDRHSRRLYPALPLGPPPRNFSHASRSLFSRHDLQNWRPPVATRLSPRKRRENRWPGRTSSHARRPRCWHDLFRPPPRVRKRRNYGSPCKSRVSNHSIDLGRRRGHDAPLRPASPQTCLAHPTRLGRPTAQHFGLWALRSLPNARCVRPGRLCGTPPHICFRPSQHLPPRPPHLNPGLAVFFHFFLLTRYPFSSNLRIKYNFH